MNDETRGFQFGVGGLLRAVLLAAVCISFFTIRKDNVPVLAAFAWMVIGLSCGGASVGTLFGRATVGAVVGLIVALLVAVSMLPTNVVVE